jgi:hypothetical protein
MGLSTTFKLNTQRQTWQDNDVKSDFDYNIGTFLVSSFNNQSGQYPMTTFKVAVAYKNSDNWLVNAELYVVVFDLESNGIKFLPEGTDWPNIFPVRISPERALYGHLLLGDDPNVWDYFSISFVFNYSAPEGNYFDIIIHTPRTISTDPSSMLTEVYTYTLYQ